jgi:hypothetical protein
MNSSSRLIILLFIFLGVIVAMMDCAKRVQKKRVHPTTPAPIESPQPPAPVP